MSGPRVSRRTALGALAAGAALLWGTPRVRAFGGVGAFEPRWLELGEPLDADRARGLSHWAFQVMQRTSAPVVNSPRPAALSVSAVVEQPLLVWHSAEPVRPLEKPERAALRRFLRLGGLLVVSDADPTRRAFEESVERLLADAAPELAVGPLPAHHVLFKSFYLLDAPAGRVKDPRPVRAASQGPDARVLILPGDPLGALAVSESRSYALDVEGGWVEREMAIRFLVNVALYLLCSDYKDDQVHAQYIMRRRSRREP